MCGHVRTMSSPHPTRTDLATSVDNAQARRPAVENRPFTDLARSAHEEECWRVAFAVRRKLQLLSTLSKWPHVRAQSDLGVTAPTTEFSVALSRFVARSVTFMRQQGGAMDFAEWFAGELPKLLRFTTALCGGPDPAEEVLQEVAIKAHRRWNTIKDLEHPNAYFRRMIINEYLSWRHKWLRLIPYAELRDHGAAEPGLADQQADRAQLIMELNRLPRRQRAVLVLRYVEGLSDLEIARTLGCSPGTVRSHASRALSTLRVEMAAVADGAEEGSHAH
jgi:RNA polymerase sigma-70 factor (sigma-E family)